ncbi:MAG: hypothetical protein QM757_26475 [Paludibaculum sp.]
MSLGSVTKLGELLRKAGFAGDILPLVARDFMPKVLPVEWRLIPQNPIDNTLAYLRRDGLRVILSAAVERDGKPWLHVSFSRMDRIPSYEDMTDVKDAFVGRDRKALQVLVPADQHVNINGNVLHLWAPLEHDPLPDFRRERQGGGFGI